MVAHVFVDAENVPPDVTFRVVEHFGKEHKITQVDIVGKEESLPLKYRDLDRRLFRVQNCFYGKNSADTWICIEIVRAIIDEPDLELIIILSSDKDFLPAIKFAADYEKKIFIVSDGKSHRNLKTQLQNIRVPPGAVELKDFRCAFDEVSQRLSQFLPLLWYDSQKILMDNADLLKFILVRKQNGKICEVPFLEGINVNDFRQMLRELKVFAPKMSIYRFCASNFLKVKNECVYLMKEEEILPPITQLETVDKFLSRNAADVIKIFVKHGEKIFEIPFVNGMPLELFGKLLRQKKIIGKTVAVSKVAEKSLLTVREEKVYLRGEEELEKICNDLADNVDQFFLEHKDEIKKIFIKHGQKIFEIPFVNGMSLENFGKLLRGKKIIGVTVSPKSIAEKSLLAVKGGKVYLRDEDDLKKVFEESLSDVDKFFNEHANELRMIFIKQGQKIFEMPFVDGMSVELFGKMLSQKNIAGRPSTVKNIAAQSLLDIREGKVFLLKEEELAAAYEEFYENVDDYLNEHALEIRSVTIRRGRDFFEIPFVNGMPLKIFGKLLVERKIIVGFTSPLTIAEESSLIMRDEKIYLRQEGLI